METVDYSLDMLVDGANPALVHAVADAYTHGTQSDKAIAILNFKLASKSFQRGIAYVMRCAFNEQEDAQRAIDYFTTNMPGVVRIVQAAPQIWDFSIVPTSVSDPMES